MDSAPHQNNLEFEVRDYECDLQAVVNNAVYQHYLEHARHKWLESIGIDFAALHEQGIDLVVTRIELDYKLPLKSGDKFVVRTSVAREGRLRLIFLQEIYRIPNEEIILSARIIGTALRGGRPSPVPDVWGKIEPFLADMPVSKRDP
jgi:acyl-CoA thioester hydrolase